MDRGLIDLARTQGGAIHRRQLRAAGVPARAITRMCATGELSAVRPLVYLVGAPPPTFAQRSWIEVLDAAAGSVLSHRTASRLHHVGRFTTSDIDVLEPELSWHRPVRSDRHRTTWLPDHHITVVDGMPVTTLERTLFDLCALASKARYRRGLPNLAPKQVERALDDALAGTLTIARCHRVLAELGGRGRPGTVLMRSLLADRGEGYVATESELEDLVLSVLARFGIDLPERQRNLGSAESPIGRVDLAYLAERVVIEADGRRNHTALLDADGDRWRDMELAAAGFVVIRVTWHQLVNEPERFARLVRSTLAARGPAPSAAAS